LHHYRFSDHNKNFTIQLLLLTFDGSISKIGKMTTNIYAADAGQVVLAAGGRTNEHLQASVVGGAANTNNNDDSSLMVDTEKRNEFLALWEKAFVGNSTSANIVDAVRGNTGLIRNTDVSFNASRDWRNMRQQRCLLF